MAEVKDKVITVDALKAKHDYDEGAYLKKEGALTTIGVTATVEELNVIDGITATTEELNYVDGVTSNIQTQLDGKSDDGHTHDYLSLFGGTMSGDITFANTHGRIYGTDYSKDANGVVKEVLVGQTLDGNTSIGYGNYYEQSGSTNIYGDTITMTSRTSGLSEREYGANKVLWEGYLHMNAGHSIALNEGVSGQPNGIVLVWSEYDNITNTVKDQGFVTHFIPKMLVQLQKDRFHAFSFMLWSDNSKQFTKGLYIGEGSITGHASNTNTSDPTAVANSYILRYVIGV